MANIFSGLESLGLGNLSGMQLFEGKDKEEEKEKKPVELKEADLIFDKSFTCKVCDEEFKVKMVRTGKAKLLAQDSDLRPIYQTVDSLKYDAIVCPHCGFAALSRFFNYMTDTQAKLIKANISSTFKGISEGGETLSYDDAIMRHKLALVNAVVKRAKASEKAYTCLKLAWLLRGKSENLPEDTPNLEAVKKELAAQEKEYIANAYEGFMAAFSKEQFPMCGMDENTMTYLVTDLARQLGKYDESLRMIARLLMSKNIGDRMKQKTIELKERIREEKMQAESKAAKAGQ